MDPIVSIYAGGFVRYRYGFGGQEKDDEVAGKGNSYTAEFWQYDSRLGRRWNIDPVVKPWESPYATFANNPMWFVDPNGADTSFAKGDGTFDKQAEADFNTANNTVNGKVNQLENLTKLFDIINSVKSEFRENPSDLATAVEGINVNKAIKETQYQLDNWNLLKSDFDYILSKGSPLITYSSDESKLKGSARGKFEGNYTNGILNSGTVTIRAGSYSTYIHENRHVRQLPTMQVFDAEVEAFIYQQIFSYYDVEKTIENSYRYANPNSDENIPRPSSFGIGEMVKINYEEQIKNEKK